MVLGEDDPAVVEKFMGFSYQTARVFFDFFLKCYLGTDDRKVLQNVTEKARFLSAIRMVNKVHKKDKRTDEDGKIINKYLRITKELADRLDTLEF